MKKKIPFILVLLFLSGRVFSQGAEYRYIQTGEFGLTAGAAHYFGDLNTRAQVNRPKLAIGGFFRRQITNYIGVRLAGHFAQLGYSDVYSNNEYQKRRNLSFNTNIFEIALMGDFNFFKFIPADPNHSFTPYASLGIGVFSYDPYAYYQNEKVYLRPLHTEGQTFYEGRKTYGTMGVAVPLAMGIKYALTDKINLSFEVGYRFTTADYLDDVSKTYVGADKFASPEKSLAGLLQDRSYELGEPIGIEGRQRGWSKQKDQYVIAEFGVSFNLTNYACPTAN